MRWLTHSHLNTLIAIAYTTMPQIVRMPICLPQSNILAPSKATLRIASFSCFTGSKLQNFCSQTGNASVEKKVPPSKNCGRVMRLANGGIELSLFETPLTMKPKPMNTIRPNKLSTIISRKVIKPCTSVNLKTKCPSKIITTAVINWNTTRLRPSPSTI